MSRKLYVNKNDVVEIYEAIIDEVEFMNVQSEIDNWYGKGSLKSKKMTNLPKSSCGRKVEIVSANKDSDLFDVSYYEFIPCALSRMCDSILKDYNVFEFSKHLRHLLEWHGESDEERLFVEKLIDTISFNKVSVDEVILSVLSLPKKKSILEKLFGILEDDGNTHIIVSPLEYDNDVEKEIEEREWFTSGFYSDELKGKEFSYSESEKVMIRRGIFESLPLSEHITK